MPPGALLKVISFALYKHVCITFQPTHVLCILYKEHYRKPGELKCRYSCPLFIFKSLREEWFMLMETLKQMILGEHDDSENSLKRMIPNCTVCSTKERRKRARTVCTRSNKGLHGECFPKHRC
jgi:hypothetical protein